MKKIFLLIAIFSLIFMSCVSNANILENRKWYLLEIEGDREIVVLNEKEPYIEFDLDSLKLSGNATCNNFFTGYFITENSIEIGEVATTLMICPDDTKQEYRFLQALSRADSFEIIEDMLYMYELNEIVLSFKSK